MPENAPTGDESNTTEQQREETRGDGMPQSIATFLDNPSIPDVIPEAMDAARDGHMPRDLLGECPYNAVRLRAELETRDVEAAVIVRGGLDLPGEPTPTTGDDLAATGLGHWWVEATIDGRDWALDLARDGHQPLGEPLVARERPDAYIAIEEPHRLLTLQFTDR